jgi:glycosyltransferase involved in cell wall biosynthesis
MKKNTIFIQIASYRDPELLPTLRDCISKARYPDNLRFGIAWQHSDEDAWDTLAEFKYDTRFKILHIPFKESKGACWARNKIQQLYSGEQYTLQLDSHHRFVQDWDKECIAMIKQLQKLGHLKPLLTSYIPSFNPTNDPAERVQTPWKMNFDRFIPEGAVFFLPAGIDDHATLTCPIPARFYSAHFAFTLGIFAEEVKHDPEYYFHGEEISIAVRAYTHGYDLFHPHKIVAWHEYTRNGRTKQWDDDPTWGERNKTSHLRNRILFGMDNETQNIDFGNYGFGTVRTLDDYEKYAGVSFKRRAVQQYTIDNKLAPNPQYTSDKEYEKSWLTIFKHCIDIAHTDVPEKDYTVWVIAFEDAEGNELYRQDVLRDEIIRLQNSDDTYIKIWRQFNTIKKPYRYIFWPHSESLGWTNKIQQIL